MLKTNLRVGITGAGVFGGFHAAKMVANNEVDFVGIYDPLHPKRAENLANKHGAKAVSSREELIDVVDALIIASPALAHGRQGLDALQQGLHVLVEKPLATDMETAREMVAVAQDKQLVLQVGHQERFVSKAVGLFAMTQAPRKISVQRVCAFSERGIDVSVTLDLMIHDLDLVTTLVGKMPIRTRAMTKVGPSGGVDEAKVWLYYEDGLKVELLASRVKQQSARTMEVVYDSGSVHVDFLNKTLIHDTAFSFNHNFGSQPDAADSLGASDNAFIDAVLNGKPTAVSGIDGARALSLALEIDQVGELATDIAV